MRSEDYECKRNGAECKSRKAEPTAARIAAQSGTAKASGKDWTGELKDKRSVEQRAL